MTDNVKKNILAFLGIITFTLVTYGLITPEESETFLAQIAESYDALLVMLGSAWVFLQRFGKSE